MLKWLNIWNLSMKIKNIRYKTCYFNHLCIDEFTHLCIQSFINFHIKLKNDDRKRNLHRKT